MSAGALSKLLTEAINNGAELRTYPNSMFGYNPMFDNASSLSSFAVTPDKQRKDLINYISDNPALAIYSHGFVRAGNRGFKLSPESVSDWAVHQILLGQSIEKITRILINFAITRTATVHNIIAFDGATINKNSEIVDSIRLMPFNDIPEGKEKTYFHNFARNSNREPTCCVCITKNIRVLSEYSDDFPKFPDHTTEERLAWDIPVILTLAGPCAPLIIGNFSIAVDIPGDSGNGAGGFIPEIRQSVATHNLNDDLVRDLITNYYQLSDENKQKILFSADRLNVSLRRNQQRDRATDLGTAIESILSQSDDGNDAVSYKMRLRSAWALGKTPQERKDIFDTMGKAYDVRSSAVHGGEIIDKKKKGRKTEYEIEDTLSKASRITAALCYSYIVESGINWSLAVLGNKPERSLSNCYIRSILTAPSQVPPTNSSTHGIWARNFHESLKRFGPGLASTSFGDMNDRSSWQLTSDEKLGSFDLDGAKEFIKTWEPPGTAPVLTSPAPCPGCA